MTLIASDALTDGRLIELPPEAGDVNAPRFEPEDDWLRAAEPAEQKAAMWRWFATRYEEITPGGIAETASAPVEAELDKEPVPEPADGPVRLDATLRERFAGRVPDAVIDDLVARVREQTVKDWMPLATDKAGG
ncbi:MAG: hypothetical protein PGN26_01170 [Xylophilus ampelinus]